MLENEVSNTGHGLKVVSLITVDWEFHPTPKNYFHMLLYFHSTENVT